MTAKRTKTGTCDACKTPNQHLEFEVRSGYDLWLCSNYRVCNKRTETKRV